MLDFPLPFENMKACVERHYFRHTNDKSTTAKAVCSGIGLVPAFSRRGKTFWRKKRLCTAATGKINWYSARARLQKIATEQAERCHKHIGPSPTHYVLDTTNFKCFLGKNKRDLMLMTKREQYENNARLHSASPNTYRLLLPFGFSENRFLDKIEQIVNVQVRLRYVLQYVLRKKPCWYRWFWSVQIYQQEVVHVGCAQIGHCVPCPSPPSSLAEWFGAQASAMSTLLCSVVVFKNVGSGWSFVVLLAVPLVVLVAEYRKSRQQSRMAILARVFLAFILRDGCIVSWVKMNTHTHTHTHTGHDDGYYLLMRTNTFTESVLISDFSPSDMPKALIALWYSQPCPAK